jgi:hypothetical protein
VTGLACYADADRCAILDDETFDQCAGAHREVGPVLRRFEERS